MVTGSKPDPDYAKDTLCLAVEVLGLSFAKPIRPDPALKQAQTIDNCLQPIIYTQGCSGHTGTAI
jgi:hypothetical protein